MTHKKEYVVLVNSTYQPIGAEEKIKAHAQRLLHLSFSIAILRKIGAVYEQDGMEILMQRRAMNKYHTPGLWTNTCCGHPRVREEVIIAAKRRLFEEFGLHIDLMQFSFFQYTAQVGDNMWENEANHVLIGLMPANQEPKPNPDEIMEYQWQSFTQVRQSLQKDPSTYTPWFPQVFKALEQESKLVGDILDHTQKLSSYTDI
ncbi:Type I isopentenyl-diphosphate isomerase [Rickettsiales endosymbiont of Paramecium tredecaurelia]|uniref:isopentenyl-diphosphate Delta-isomerase n=1 Tax=Candidatus Sarmatiella mevalonica TaxID=2770581 RepID=UPI0019237FC1|nr:isopentenyl-diphosphate Delta-isomerase [Candidatus Sarmatiella mevalonica]MBL3284290.1 Type I isopentenyl-diphosphate isomerase [Candidatus Sarmatiella mevalonica]